MSGKYFAISFFIATTSAAVSSAVYVQLVVPKTSKMLPVHSPTKHACPIAEKNTQNMLPTQRFKQNVSGLMGSGFCTGCIVVPVQVTPQLIKVC